MEKNEANDHNNSSIPHKESEEEIDEALSLSEFPLNNEQLQTLNHQTTPYSNRRSSSEPQEFFEFFTDFNSDEDRRRDNMCSAEDIIFCGRLIPYGEQPPPKSPPSPAKSPPEPAIRRRSESLSELQSDSKTTETMIMRTSRSLDYQKLRRGATEEPRPFPAGKRSEISASPKKTAKLPRWPALLVFGMVKLPAEMELGDIKSRQARRNVDGGVNFPVSRSSSGKGSGGGGASWKLLKALSCKDHASVAVTASFCVPQV